MRLRELKGLLLSESGGTLVEYSIILLFAVSVTVVGLVLISGKINPFFTGAASAI